MFKPGKYLLTAAVLICAFVFPTPSVAEDSAGSNKNSAQITVTESKYKRTDVKLLKVGGLSNRAAEKNINKTLHQEAAAFANEYQIPHFSSDIKSKVIYNQNNLLSVILLEYYYMEGAAHPMTFQKSFVFDLLTGKKYELGQIFEPYSGYEDTLNTMIMEQIKQVQVPLLEPFETIDAQQEFYLKDDALVIYYQRYRYTPYAHGFLEFEIQYGEIKDILAEKFKKLGEI